MIGNSNLSASAGTPACACKKPVVAFSVNLNQNCRMEIRTVSLA